MIVRRLPTVHGLLAALAQPTAEMQALHALLMEQGRSPCRRTWERRLATLPDRLPAHFACLGRYLADLLQPWGDDGRIAAIESTVLRANGGVWHKKHREANIGQFKGIFDANQPVPTRGLQATRRFALGAVLVYQLTRWHRFEEGADLRIGLKPFLKAA